jgi:sigma-B regulation protein RsbU (phosphoserine phosphatase)
MKRFTGLSFRLSVTVLAISLTAFLVILLINYSISRKYLTQDALRDAGSISALAVSEIQNALGNASLPLLFLSEFLEEHPADTATLMSSLRLLSAADSRIVSSFVHLQSIDSAFGTDGRERHLFRNGTPATDMPEQEFEIWQRQLLTKKQAFWSEPYHPSNEKSQRVAYILPLKVQLNNGLAAQGFVGVEMHLQWLSHLISTKGIYDSDYLFILSGDGIPLLSPASEKNGNEDIFQIARRLNNPEIVELASAMIAGKSGSMLVSRLFVDQGAMVYYTPIGMTDWSLAVVFPEKDLFGELYHATFILILSSLAGFLLILFAVVYITKRLTKPLRQLADAAGEIGKGKFDADLPVMFFNDEVAMLKQSLENMQEELKNYIKQMIKSETYREKIESELRVAKDIQMGLLRNDFDEISGGGHIEVAGRILPARQIGGDFYDYFMVKDNLFCFAVGDVSGKGIPAAIFMARVLTLLRSGDFTTGNPGKVVAEINRALAQNNEQSIFTTLFVAILDITNGEMVFCNAGHNYPYLLQDATLYEMKTTHGMAVGVFEKAQYKTAKITLRPGDIIVAYTDGVTEAVNSNGELFGKELLEQNLISYQSGGMRKLNLGLSARVLKFSGNKQQHDDITVFSLEFKRRKQKSSG